MQINISGGFVTFVDVVVALLLPVLLNSYVVKFVYGKNLTLMLTLMLMLMLSLLLLMSV